MAVDYIYFVEDSGRHIRCREISVTKNRVFVEFHPDENYGWILSEGIREGYVDKERSKSWSTFARYGKVKKKHFLNSKGERVYTKESQPKPRTGGGFEFL